LFLLFLIQVVFAVPVHEVPNPRHDNVWVTDMRDVLSQEDEAAVNEISEALYRDLTVEVTTVTIDDCEGSPKAFATKLFNHWGIGNEQANNGLLVLLVMDQRRLEMETGDGLQDILTSSSLKAIQSDVMVPNFKRGDFGAGLRAGLEYVDMELRRQTEQALDGNRDPNTLSATKQPRSTREPAEELEQLAAEEWSIFATIMTILIGLPFLVVIGIVALITGALYWLVQAFRRSRGRHCKNCGINRNKLSEVDDDEYLSDGQQHEEHIASVNYEVYICAGCQSTGIVRYGRWFSGYSQCPSCSYKTMTTTSRTIQPATRSSSGLCEVTEKCHFRDCSRHHVYRRTIPRLQDTSSSSSSSGGGSSFGGGSSSGGGAGSSW
jgi:uncharacterized protein